MSDPHHAPDGTTARSLAHSPTATLRLFDVPELIVALARVKHAAARANHENGLLPSTVAEPIEGAAQRFADGHDHDAFCLPVIAAGGGTATNMNANEAIAAAARAGGVEVHPNDHVNLSQSSNDVYPTALKLALHPIAVAAADELARLAATFRIKAEEYASATRLGRTVWQDAVLVPIRDTHLGQAAAMQRLSDGLRTAARRLLAVQLGGTVLGTRAGSSQDFAERALGHLAGSTGLDLRPSESLTDAFAHSDVFSEVADAVARAGAVLHKIGQDLRVLSSGPVGGLRELTLPSIQPGSSIMPGKVNPVIPNMVIQASFGIRSASYAVSMAVAAGEPDINVNGPAVTASLYPALHALRENTAILNDHCVAGMVWNLDRLEEFKAGSYEDLMELARARGYDTASRSASTRGVSADA
ncbi:lyase family protein [Prauserella cavernicola]|uniref:Aspartate ammonia-lyase n=1 Tax=Prauserella cavernicola TaxID=2800127 RepID=A0A934V1R9_9PSEU|nr:lyase family protein [Prauserella cavernicola]MBK1783776.1 aspartate ammonia-lyase [Prauserella cavernicola]